MHYGNRYLEPLPIKVEIFIEKWKYVGILIIKTIYLN